MEAPLVGTELEAGTLSPYEPYSPVLFVISQEEEEAPRLLGPDGNPVENKNSFGYVS
jgi:hypothetical protein